MCDYKNILIYNGIHKLYNNEISRSLKKICQKKKQLLVQAPK